MFHLQPRAGDLPSNRKSPEVRGSLRSGYCLEARTGFEPAYNGFANRCLTTWLPRLTRRMLRGWESSQGLSPVKQKDNAGSTLTRGPGPGGSRGASAAFRAGIPQGARSRPKPFELSKRAANSQPLSCENLGLEHQNSYPKVEWRS